MKPLILSVSITACFFSASLNSIRAQSIVITVAGNANMGYTSDGGLADTTTIWGNTWNRVVIKTDSHGNLYFTDARSTRVRKIDAITGIMSTVAGTGFGCYTGNGGPADSAQLSDPVDLGIDDSDNIYILDGSEQDVRKIEARNNIISQLAGCAGQGTGYSVNGYPADSTLLIYPWAMALDAAANIFVSDNQTRIRRIDATTNIITAFAGDTTAGYAGDGGSIDSAEFSGPAVMAFSKAGDLYLCDVANSRIRKIDMAAGTISTIAGNGGNYTPLIIDSLATSVSLIAQSIALDSVGNLYFTTQAFPRIFKIDAQTQIISSIAGTDSFGFAGDGGPANQAWLSTLSGLHFDRNGNLYFADGPRIREIIFNPTAVPSIAPSANHVYPNPCDGILNVEINNWQQPCMLDIYNVMGENVYHAESANAKTTLDLSAQANGIYLFRVTGGGNISEDKIVISR